MMTNPTGRITQGQFSFLPDLTDAEIALQVEYGLRKGYAWSIEYTDDPHPRNTYWEMYGMPMFDPEMSGNDGFNATVRYISEHIPAPATFTTSLRISF